MDVIIDHVKYVPEKQELKLIPNMVSFWYMKDNHTFTKLEGKTLDEIADQTDNIDGKFYGMLCRATLLHDEKEIRRVGINVHRGTKKISEWEVEKQEWKEALKSDKELMDLLSEEESEKDVKVEPQFYLTFKLNRDDLISIAWKNILKFSFDLNSGTTSTLEIVTCYDGVPKTYILSFDTSDGAERALQRIYAEIEEEQYLPGSVFQVTGTYVSSIKHTSERGFVG